MRILHVSSDWKWTGPAEPMLRLLVAQRERGHEAELACPEAPAGSGAGVADRARAAGVEPICRLAPGRGVRLRRDAPDARRLCAVLEERGFDVLHTWHTRDHVLAWRAAQRRRRAARARRDAAPSRCCG